MNTHTEHAQHVVDVMNNTLSYNIPVDEDINKQSSLINLPFHINTDEYFFYTEYFNTVCRQIQLLVALNEHKQTNDLCTKTCLNLGTAIQTAAKCSLEIVLHIPRFLLCCGMDSDQIQHYGK